MSLAWPNLSLDLFSRDLSLALMEGNTWKQNHPDQGSSMQGDRGKPTDCFTWPKNKKATSRKRQAASPPQAGVGKKLFTK